MPDLASRYAVVSPVMPPPMTHTSTDPRPTNGAYAVPGDVPSHSDSVFQVFDMSSCCQRKRVSGYRRFGRFMRFVLQASSGMDDAASGGRCLTPRAVTRERGHGRVRAGSAGRGDGAMSEIIPRWEWRTFGSSFGVAEARFAALDTTGVQESDELYLVSATDANVKVRDDLMDVKVLVETNADGLEQWRPIMKAEFPVGATDIARIFDSLRRSAPSLARDSYSLDEFNADLAPAAGLRPINVHKRRVRYKVGGCTSEVTDVVADGAATRTIAIESEDAAAVVAAVKSVELSNYVNTSYG